MDLPNLISIKMYNRGLALKYSTLLDLGKDFYNKFVEQVCRKMYSNSTNLLLLLVSAK